VPVAVPWKFTAHQEERVTSDSINQRSTVRALTAAALAVATAIGLALAVVMSAPTAQAATTLGASAAESGRIFGTAVARSRLSESQYANILNTEFNGVTPENEQKWDATEPSRNSFNYANADAIVSHARARNMTVRGHTLVWHNQLPSWVSNISTGTELLTVMRNHISNVAGHFAGQLAYWDVVNEAFEENGSRRNSVFQQRIGNSYIEEAFRAARAADPSAKLCYNDYNTDGINAKSDAVLALVRDFKARGVPIDCVGMQAHLVVGQVPGNMQQNLARFAAEGVDVHITELDIRMPTPPSSSNLQTQAANYRSVIQACMAVPRCTNMTVWGITDRYSWVPDTFPGEGAALLWDDNYNKKPAYATTLAALGGTNPTDPTSPTTPPTSPSTPNQPPGACRVAYTMSTWNTGFTANVSITNTGSAAINGWRLQFTLPSGQTVTGAWSASISPTSGAVTATNASYNGSLAAGATTTMGFQANHTGNTAEPTAFTLNGSTCQVV
jgi:endo-1,4-beta-xylanase